MNPQTQARVDLVHPPAEPAAGLVPAAQVARNVPMSRAGQGGLPQAQAVALSPMSIVRALRRRALLALGIAVLAAGIAGPAAWYLIPTSFKAQAKLQVAAEPPKVLFQTVETLIHDDYKRYQSTQQTLVKSHLVLSSALRDPRVGGCSTLREQVDPVEWLSDNLKVEFAGGSEVMEISLSGRNPEDLALLVNAVVKAYMDEVVDVDARRRTGRRDQLIKYREKYADLLKRKRETMRKLAETVGSDDPSTMALRQQFAMEDKHYLETELRGVQSQRRKLEAQLKAMGSARETEAETPSFSESQIDQAVDRHPAVAELADRLAGLEAQRDEVLAKVQRLSRRPSVDPALHAVNKAMKTTQQLLAGRRREVRQEVIQQAQERGTIGEDPESQDVGRDLAMLADLERRLKDEIQAISISNHSLTTNTLDLQGNQEEIAQMQATADKIAAEVEALNVELEAPPRIRRIDEASVPQTRNDKKRLTMIGMITFGSFFGCLFGIAFLELQTCKVDSADEVPVELGLAIVGALPILPARSQRPGAIVRRETEKDRYWRNVLLESVDATRTLLLHAARTDAYRVIMITSAVSGEGKTSLASYLATSLARTGLRTLLIDGDLRSPVLHRLFEVSPAPGLSELLRGEVASDDALAATAVEDLVLLPAGRCDRQALRILSQGGIAPLFDRLKQRFDFIIVDSSPILPVADAMLVAQHVDTALFSIFREVSRKTKVKAACERLRRLGVPVLGAVVTGAHGGTYGNDYYDPDSSYPGLPESVAAPSSQPS